MLKSISNVDSVYPIMYTFSKSKGGNFVNYKKIFEYWLNDEFFDDKTKSELISIQNDDAEIQERFYKELEFGTAGLRGKIGAGTNRMNRYIVSRAAKGLADVICEYGEDAKKRGVVIAYDCRHFSSEFARISACVLCENGINAYLFEGMRPTPELSYAVRRLNAISGIVVTASHNPRDYNGFKVYWEEGSQILSDMADKITEKISKIKDFREIVIMPEQEALDRGLLHYIGKEIDDLYIESVKSLALRDEDIDKNVTIVYSPLNGTGNVPVRRVLAERGFKNVFVVPEQENADPDFKTVGYPNPEDVKAFEYAIKLGRKKNADILIATDPDCDRLAVMVKNNDDEYVPLTGNQTGALLVQYILKSRMKKRNLPENPVIVKSIVTDDLGAKIADNYGVKTIESLTGFKNICGKANEYDITHEYDFIFGYEESIGFVYGTSVRDKDAVSSSMLLAEAAAYYRKKGMTLLDALDRIYIKYGIHGENNLSIVLEGIEGQKRIERMMASYREDSPDEFGKIKIVEKIDFLDQEKIAVPRTNALKFTLDDGSWYALRPSGTEPKIKLYIYSFSDSKAETDRKLRIMKDVILDKLYSIK